jgi:heparin/heparan-sulfate lyase
MLLLSLLCLALPLFAADLSQMVRRDHPRLFFNRETFPAVKALALGAEAANFAALAARSAELVTRPVEVRDYGPQAAEAAFAWLVTGEDRYQDLAQSLLDASIRFYEQCHAEKRTINWYSFSRINAIAAFDWLYNSMPPEMRKNLGARLLQTVEQSQPTRARRAYDRENWGGTQSGFYGTPSLLWFAGLATFRDGISDDLAERFLTEGYGQFIKVLEHRRHAAGDDGGSASGALNYALAAYPWAESNFFQTYTSATGRDITRDWPHVAWLPGYIFWNWLPGGREFGYGDAYHIDNRIRASELNLHLSHIIQAYAGSQPEAASFAKWLAEKLPREQRATFPIARFSLTSMPSVAPAKAPESRMPLARMFENMGQTFFRSGSGADDTYAMFTAGGVLAQHKHFDHNSFTIYKKGFLAIDTGTRPEPGQHLTHYYARTVAHNSILIRMPGEQMPRYWGGPAPDETPLPVPNDGGQRTALGSKAIAFETHPEYAYIAGDATATYHEGKCRQAVRQFIFLPPDHFVVFDRVSAVRPEYRKTWLLHFVEEPTTQAAEFSVAHEQGRLIARTLLPEAATLEKIGGPGKQFWSDGRNWPLPKGWRVQDTEPLLGQWRVEVSPANASADDVFLHVIQVGERSLEGMVPTRLRRGRGQAGVSLSYKGCDWEVVFATEGPVAGHITIRRGGTTLLNRELAHSVMPQAGLYPK